MNYKGIARGKIIELDESLPCADGQPVSVIAEPAARQPQAGSPAAVRQAMHKPPHLTREEVDELEHAIEEAKLPVH